MNERVFNGEVDRLRTPERVALLQVDRVLEVCLQDITPRSVLDVGTGSGIFAEAFAARGLQVAGIDTNRAMIEDARRHVPAGDFREAPAEKIPHADRSFDLVYLGHVLHETDDAAAALREARRVARVRVAVLEWPYVEEEKGPPLHHRLPADQVARAAVEAGLGKPEVFPLAHMVLYRFDLGRV